MRCDQCRHFAAFSPTMGHCRIHAPKVVEWRDADHASSSTVWPEVAVGDFCGEYLGLTATDAELFERETTNAVKALTLKVKQQSDRIQQEKAAVFNAMSAADPFSKSGAMFKSPSTRTTQLRRVSMPGDPADES